MTRNGIGIRTAQVRSERLVGQIHVYDGTKVPGGSGRGFALDWGINTRIATAFYYGF